MGDKVKTTEKPAAEDGVVAKCAACATEQAATHKFCGDCGKPMVSAVRTEYETALAALGDFHKASTALSPTLEVQAGDHPAPGTVAKSATGDIDEAALVELLVGGNHAMVDRLVALSGEARATRMGLGEFAGLLVKALTSGFTAQVEPVLARLEALQADFADWRDQPGRSRAARTADVTTFHKSNPALELGAEDDSLRGALLVKAAVDLGDARKLSNNDVTEVEHWANCGATLQTLPRVAPALAARLANAGLVAIAQ